jgi:hypothetical protein
LLEYSVRNSHSVCVTDPVKDIASAQHFAYTEKEGNKNTLMRRNWLLKVGYKPPLAVSILCLLVSVFLFVTEPGTTSTEAERVALLLHRFYGYVFLLPAILFGTLAAIVYRKNKPDELRRQRGE